MISPTRRSPVGELPPSLVRVLDRALDSVAEAELAGEPDVTSPDDERVLVRPQLIDDPPS